LTSGVTARALKTQKQALPLYYGTVLYADLYKIVIAAQLHETKLNT